MRTSLKFRAGFKSTKMMKRKLLMFVASCWLLVACVPSTGSPTTSPGEVNANIEKDVNSLDMDDPLVRDAMAFAEHQGITLEEAVLRLEHQQTIGDIQPPLEADLPETYGGLWVEHQPEYRIVIALTEGDESTIRPYIEGKPWAEFVEVQHVENSLSDLKDAQAVAIGAAKDINIVVSSAIDVIQNRVEIIVGDPDLFRADLATAGIELPEPVEILPIELDKPLPDTNQGVLIESKTADERTIYLPKQPPTEASMAALMEGMLIEENGCLRVIEEGNRGGFLVLWPFDSNISVSGESIEVLNGAGQVVARVGERLRIGGGAMESPSSMARFDDVIPGLPIDGCPGPYWIAGELETLAAQAIPDIYINPFSSGGRILAMFIYQSRPSVAEGTLSGVLVVDDQGCMRVEDYIILWPPGVYLREDPLRLFNENRKTIGQVGEAIQLRGAEKSSQDYRYFDNKIPCPGPYWGVAEVIPVTE